MAPKNCVKIHVRFRRRKGVLKYFPVFSGAGEVYLNISPAPEKYYLSDTSPAPEKPGKYLKTHFRRRRSAYIHLFGAGEAEEAGEAGEVFIYMYTPNSSVSSNAILTKLLVSSIDDNSDRPRPII